MTTRVDLSQQLIHLTRGEPVAHAEATFRNIVKERRLNGSNLGVRGGHSVVCFSEAPVDVIARMFSNGGRSFRYRPFGVMLPKAWLFSKGGRPVIYQPEEDFPLLPADLQYRHVRLDAPGTDKDFTFEREWRICTESISLDPSVCTLIVPTRDWDYRLREEHDQSDMAKARAYGIDPLTRIARYEWHVLALGDLGATFPLNEGAT